MLYFYFHISIWIFCTLFICFALDGFLQLICFRMFCSSHSITFKNTHLLSYLLHFVADIFYIKFRFCELSTVINSVTIILLIETLHKFRTFKCRTFLEHLPCTYARVFVFFVSINSNMFRSRLAFLRFTFHWYFHFSNK